VSRRAGGCTAAAAAAKVSGMEPEDVERTMQYFAMMVLRTNLIRNARDGREHFSPSAGSLPVLQVQCSAVRCSAVWALLSEDMVLEFGRKKKKRIKGR
jgi:hypothetical protein